MDTDEEKPGAHGMIVHRTVSNKSVAARFEQDVFPGKKKYLLWNRKMYVMPDGARDAIVEPMMVYRFAPIQEGADGAPISMGVRVFGFSLSDAQSAPIDMTGR